MSNSSQAMTREKAVAISDDLLGLYIQHPWFVDVQPMKDDGGMHLELTVTSLRDMESWGISRSEFEHYEIRICLIEAEKEVSLDA